MASTLTNLLYHIVFSTKRRLNLIEEEFENDLHSYMGGIVRANSGVAIQIGGISNHVHMLIRLNAATTVADMVRLVKTGSSKWLNEQFGNKNRFGWQNGYGAFSVSESALDRVRFYVQNQKQHHQTQLFDNEYKILVERHAIPYDPKYFLD